MVYKSTFTIRTAIGDEEKYRIRYVCLTYEDQKAKEDDENDYYDLARDPIEKWLNETHKGEKLTTTGDEDIEEGGTSPETTLFVND